jgi:predicted DNA-binding WGR domain protein
MEQEIWYLELTEESGSHKFYEVVLENTQLNIRYGRIGDTGQTQTKSFSNAQEARADAEKRLREKRKKGYADAVLGKSEKKALPLRPTFPKFQITGFTEALEPVTKPITKFGGQPVWLEEPRWAICPGNGQKIPFLCQIELISELFGEIKSKIAYIFHGGNPDGSEPGWLTDHGDTAIVLQPGNLVFHQDMGISEHFIIDKTGPTLQSITQYIDGKYISRDVEYLPITKNGNDHAHINEKQSSEARMGHKIGGTPFLWDDEFMPDGGQSDWSLLLQMESTDATEIETPFGVYYGDGGCGWWYISRDGTKAEYFEICG